MTSTNVFKGNFGEKPTSRVLKPPGGGNSNIFGLPDEPAKPVNPPKKIEENFTRPQEPIKIIEKNGDTNTAEKTEEKKVVQKSDNTMAAGFKVQPAVNTSYKQRHQASYNPITGESYSKENAPQEKPSTTVRQPPGGVSTRLW